MGIVVALFGIVVLAAVAAVVVAGVLALRGKSKYDASNQLIPGVSTSAPGSWAGSHDPEARLHRRLRDALAALAANQAFDDNGTLLDLRVELQQQAIALDEQLVATAALPLNLRADPLERISGAVGSIEQAVAGLAGASATEAASRINRVLEDVTARTGLVAQARAALDELGPLPGGAPAMPTPAPVTEPPAPVAEPPAPVSEPPVAQPADDPRNDSNL